MDCAAKLVGLSEDFYNTAQAGGGIWYGIGKSGCSGFSYSRIDTPTMADDGRRRHPSRRSQRPSLQGQDTSDFIPKFPSKVDCTH